MISGSSINNNPQSANIQYGAVRDVVPNDINQKLPENLQNLDAQQIANNNGAFSAAQNMNKETLLLTLPIYASFVGLRTLNDSKNPFFGFAGKFEDTILGKLSKAGDMATKGFRKLIPDSVEFKAIDKLKAAKSWVLDHSAIARSLTTPISYENRMAISEANGLFGRVMADNAIMFEKGYHGGLKELRALFGKDTKIWQLLKDKGIEKCAGNAEEARKIVSTTLRELGEKPVKSKEVQEYAKEIIQSFAKSDQSIVIDKWGKFPIGKIPIIGKLFTLKVPASEISNKLRVSAGVSGAELAEGGAAALGVTTLGRGLASTFSKIHEGFTSDFVGGKLAPIMQAYFIASAAMKAKDAPKGQKLATFADEESGAVTFLITMPIATKLLARIGGMKYMGIGGAKTVLEQQANKDLFKEMVAKLNEKVTAGTISRGEYVEEAKKIKDFLKGETRFWQKPLKLLGRIIGSNFKADTVKPFLEDVSSLPEGTSALKTLGVKTSNKVQSLLYRLKTGWNVDGTKSKIGGTFGGILRFALVMFVLSPIVSKPIKWLVNKIFGKPYEPDKKDKKDKKADKNNLTNPEVNPFVNLSDQEFMTLLQKNQANMEKAQSDPQLMQELQSDPKKLYDFLVQGAAQYDEALKNAKPSSMLQNYINQAQNGAIQPQQPIPNTQTNNGLIQQNLMNPSQMNQNGFNNNAQMPAPQIQTQQATAQPQQTAEPQRSYIPSSAPAVNAVNAKQQHDARFNAIMQDMDNTEKEFSKYLGI